MNKFLKKKIDSLVKSYLESKIQEAKVILDDWIAYFNEQKDVVVAYFDSVSEEVSTYLNKVISEILLKTRK